MLRTLFLAALVLMGQTTPTPRKLPIDKFPPSFRAQAVEVQAAWDQYPDNACVLYQVAALYAKSGDKQEALAVHRKAMALRRELAAAEGADVETRLDVARSLRAVGPLLDQTGDPTGALAAFEEQRDIATTLVGVSTPKKLKEIARWMSEGMDLSLLAEVQELLKPIQNKTWPSGLKENN